MRPSRAARVVRGSAAASGATFVALLSHVAGGGAMPGWLGIAVPLILSVAVATLLAGRRLSLWRLALTVTLSQALFHVLFVLGAPTQSAVVAAHDHAAPLALPVVEAVATPWTGATMWLMHGIAAVATTLLLHRGERAARRLWATALLLGRWLRRRVDAVTGGVREPARILVTAVCGRMRAAHSCFLGALAGRAPPLTAHS